MTLGEALRGVLPADAGAMQRAAARRLTLTKPPGSLGRLEEVSAQLAGVYGAERPAVRATAVIVAAGDHGVMAQGPSGLLGGVTGDIYGAVSETAEAAVLVLAVILTAGAAGALPDA